MRTILTHVSPRALEMSKSYAKTISECIVRIEMVEMLVRGNEMDPHIGEHVVIGQRANIKYALDEINRYLKLDEIKN